MQSILCEQKKNLTLKYKRILCARARPIARLCVREWFSSSSVELIFATLN